MSCYDCKYFTGEKFLPCTVDRNTAAKSPELGCLEWRPRKPRSCYDCKKFNIQTHHCGVYIAHTAKNPPFEGCSDWQPSKPQRRPSFWWVIILIACLVAGYASFLIQSPPSSVIHIRED